MNSSAIRRRYTSENVNLTKKIDNAVHSQQNCWKDDQQQAVAPRIINNGNDVTPLPLTTSWSLPVDHTIDDHDPIIGKKQLISCGRYIPWMHSSECRLQIDIKVESHYLSFFLFKNYISQYLHNSFSMF